jgi:hypothetical protein
MSNELNESTADRRYHPVVSLLVSRWHDLVNHFSVDANGSTPMSRTALVGRCTCSFALTSLIVHELVERRLFVGDRLLLQQRPILPDVEIGHVEFHQAEQFHNATEQTRRDVVAVRRRHRSTDRKQCAGWSIVRSLPMFSSRHWAQRLAIISMKYFVYSCGSAASDSSRRRTVSRSMASSICAFRCVWCGNTSVFRSCSMSTAARTRRHTSDSRTRTRPRTCFASSISLMMCS